MAGHIAELNQKNEKYKYVGGIVEMRSGVWYCNGAPKYVYENDGDWELFEQQ